MKNLKDKLTTWVAIILVVVEAVNAYLQSTADGINWYQLVMAVIVAVIAYLTGKKPNGTAKSDASVSEINVK